jgi:2-keto-4-pentenoate hydratase/2-oxohepta-3-ene-1,7-dioic acid hydratase in catechol pathway
VKLATFSVPGSGYPRAGTVQGDLVQALAGDLDVADILAAGATPELADQSWPLSDVELLAPIPSPGTIYGIGMNYARHIEEVGLEAPQEPLVFVKVRASLAPPGGPIHRPAVVHRLDYEGELALVMGAGGRIAGYCIADDVTARDLQGREAQWTRAKGADTFCPVGPWITTADEVPDPGRLRLRTWVNGELRQDSSTADLIFGCQELVEFIGQTCTLEPGDLILTGTPNGVGMGFDPPRFLEPGDVVRIEIEGLGTIEHPVA